jgi:hypothetical protein
MHPAGGSGGVPQLLFSFPQEWGPRGLIHESDAVLIVAPATNSGKPRDQGVGIWF